MSRHGAAGAMLLAVVCAALAGCGSSKSNAGRGTTTAAGEARTTAASGPAAHGAPRAFTARGVALPPAASANTNVAGSQVAAAPVALAGTTIFLATGT